jgi:hypothetical protein
VTLRLALLERLLQALRDSAESQLLSGMRVVDTSSTKNKRLDFEAYKPDAIKEMVNFGYRPCILASKDMPELRWRLEFQMRLL